MKNFVCFILTIISIVFFLLWANKKGKDIIVEKELVYNDTVYMDTVKQVVQGPDSIVYVDKVLPGRVDTFYILTDTQAIIKDYLSEVYGSHILKDDSTAFISFDYTLQGNRLKEIRKSIYQNRQPISITNIAGSTKHNHFFIGSGLFISDRADVNLNISYQTNKWQYTGGYFLRNKALYLGVSYQLH